MRLPMGPTTVGEGGAGGGEGGWEGGGGCIFASLPSIPAKMAGVCAEAYITQTHKQIT